MLTIAQGNVMETMHNFQQQQITGKSSQTMVFDPKVTAETDELNPDFQKSARKMIRPITKGNSKTEARQRSSPEDIGLNHDQRDELSLNIEDGKALK